MGAGAVAREILRAGFHGARRLGLPGLDGSARRAAVIVRYHSVSDPLEGSQLYLEPSIAVPPAVFERQIALLAHRYACISMDRLIEGLAGGRPLPRNAAVVTFDDGYRDNYDYAYPLLRRHRVPAMFYVATGCLDGGRPLWTSEVRCLVLTARRPRAVLPALGLEVRLTTPEARREAIAALKARLVTLPRAEREAALDELRERVDGDTAVLDGAMLTWAQVREMQRGGMDFGAHTVSHPRLPLAPPTEAAQEIVGSRAALEERLGLAVRHFSYPNPGKGVHWDGPVAQLVVEAGFQTAVTSQSGYVHAGDDALALARMPVSGGPWAFALDLERPALVARLGGRARPAPRPSRDGAPATSALPPASPR
jgi:peptidoglycan/xylan/chitin deacetylase (PgdA/CDA1 family)